MTLKFSGMAGILLVSLIELAGKGKWTSIGEAKDRATRLARIMGRCMVPKGIEGHLAERLDNAMSKMRCS